jgi:hypothetical protein
MLLIDPALLMLLIAPEFEMPTELAPVPPMDPVFVRLVIEDVGLT